MKNSYIDNPEYYNDAEYKIVVEFKFDNSMDIENKEYFISNSNGSLKFIQKLSPPPLLNNNILQDALENEIITNVEFGRLRNIGEDDRYYLIRIGEDWVKHCFNCIDDDHKLAENAWRKINNQ